MLDSSSPDNQAVLAWALPVAANGHIVQPVSSTNADASGLSSLGSLQLDGYGIRTHSDLWRRLKAVSVECTDAERVHLYGYLALAHDGIIFAVAFGMKDLLFRIPESEQTRAIQYGATPFSACGPRFMRFNPWPQSPSRIEAIQELKLWCELAYGSTGV